jgi:hypothetical protein
MKSEIVIALDASGMSGSIAIAEAGNMDVICESGLSSHTLECMLPKLDALLRENGLCIEQTSSFITSSGPGSFTGLRLCFSTLKAFCAVLKARFCYVDSAEARMLSWMEEQAAFRVGSLTELVSITRIGASRVVVSRYNMNDRLISHAVSEVPLREVFSGPVLLDTQDLPGFTPSPARDRFLFPMKATYLIRAFSKAATASMVNSPAEISRLVPNYYGERSFLTSAAALAKPLSP